MVFKRLRPFEAFRYCLDTFTENRTCERLTVPYNGREVDGAGNGPPPNCWDIQKRPPHLFRDSVYHMPLPHTSSVMKCFQCCGHGSKGCIICCGSGRSRCMACGGSGWFINQTCIACYGNGDIGCLGCRGTGFEPCTTCCGQGRLVTYIQLTIKWENHNVEFLAYDKTDFPTKRFDEVTGKILFSDEQQTVSPVTNFPEPLINEASEDVISEHRSEFADCKILRQRHTIEWLPLTKVYYTWKDAEYYYYVYGKENRAYVEDYPKKSCAIM
ncbi:protein SSUH2 homolog isoform X2 [Eleutherodactylus coqui]